MRGSLRTQTEDFAVDEDLGFTPDGEGQHWLVRVRKVGVNTEWVARVLAQTAGVPIGAIGYAGLKDRHALARQWFSVPVVSDRTPDWAAAGGDALRVLETHRHRRKLRRGALAGNRFCLRIRQLVGDCEALAERLPVIAGRGVPNYFGEQRFGIAAGNLTRATAYFRGEIGRLDRHRRGLYLSAARSQLFNELLALRVARADWDRALAGDRLQLAGSRSHFLVDAVEADIEERVRSGDLHPTGPLWGRGAPPTAGEPARLEQQVAERFAPWAAGLDRAGLGQERRALRLLAQGLQWSWSGLDTLELHFMLPAGGYATTLVRELIDEHAGS